MSLDVSKLENIRELDSNILQARCPACAEGGNKLISPQHVIWLLPLAALGVVSTRALYRVPAVLVLVAAVFTQAEYPFLYDNMVGLHVAGVLAVAIRNGLLVAAYVAALVILWRLGSVEEPASGPAPGGHGRTALGEVARDAL